MKKPNILFLFPDQHRGDWMPYEKEYLEKIGIDKLPIKMPNLRKIMDKGVSFTNAITPSPLCAPARACLASGKCYEDCRVPNNGADYPLDLTTFYSALRDGGYSVGGVGKFDVHKKTLYWGLDGWIDDLDALGFTHGIDNAGKLDAGHSGKDEPKDPYMYALDKRGYREYHSKNIINRKHDIEPTELPEDLYCDNWLSENAINMINDFPKDKSWFLQVNFTGPHDPWDVTYSMRERWKDSEFDEPHNFTSTDENKPNLLGIRQNYAAMLENIDRQIGRMIECIENKGELDNTIIVYCSDHGEMLGDRGLFAKSQPYRGSVNIPLVISTPQMDTAVISNSLVELNDLAKTFTDLAQVSFDEKDSMSLLPIINGEKNTHREILTSSLINKKVNWNSVQNHDYKVIYNFGEVTAVYEISKDIWEDDNLLLTNKEKAEEIIKILN